MVCRGMLNGTAFCYFCSNCDFSQLIDEPTRDKNILNLLLPNDALLISDLVVNVPFCTSDHNSIHFSILTECMTDILVQIERSYAWNKADWIGFARYCIP